MTEGESDSEYDDGDGDDDNRRTQRNLLIDRLIDRSTRRTGNKQMGWKRASLGAVDAALNWRAYRTVRYREGAIVARLRGASGKQRKTRMVQDVDRSMKVVIVIGRMKIKMKRRNKRVMRMMRV